MRDLTSTETEPGAGPRSVRRLLAVPALLVVVSLWQLRSWVLGDAAPPWDFWGGYTTTAFSWWDLGSFFSPPSTLPYLFGGYPAHLALQASSWYLPVGVVHLLFGYTPHAAAALQAITCAFGVVGFYALAKRLGLASLPSVAGSIGYLFSAGFFSNAQHTDISRAWAFLPWLLLTLMPMRQLAAWKMLLASILWFQFLVGAYPGNIAAAFYLCLAWAAAHCWYERTRLGPYIYWIAGVTIPAALMSTIKWLPYILSAQPDELAGNSILTTPGVLATLMFPFIDDTIPGDITMRTLFVVPTLILAAFFVRRRARLVSLAAILIIVALLLGFDTALWSGWQESLPLLDVSRFRTADFKVGLSIGIALLGAAGLSTLLYGWTERIPTHWWTSRLQLAGLLAAFIGVLGVTSGLSPTNAKLGVLWIALAATSLTGAAVASRYLTTRTASMIHDRNDRREEWTRATPAAFIIVITYVLGSWWAQTAEVTWRVPRLANEVAIWGAPVADLIAEQAPTQSSVRPRRSGPELPTEAGILLSGTWNRAEYSRQPSLGGYVNLKGQPIADEILALVSDPDSVAFFEALSLESVAWNRPPGSTAGVGSEDCFFDGTCIEADLVVTSWSPDTIAVNVPDGPPRLVVLNEVAYPGWFSQVCDRDACTRASVESGPTLRFLAAEVPAGASTVEFVYETPGLRTAWILFALGLKVLIIAAFLPRLGSKVRDVRTSRKGQAPCPQEKPHDSCPLHDGCAGADLTTSASRETIP